MTDIKLECAGFIEASCDDGPGIRTVLFLQGCSKNCKSCHNAKINKRGQGTFLTISVLMELLKQKCCNKKITISGGEPLEQYDSLIPFLYELKSQGYNICLYTGWELHEVPIEIFNLVNYLKTGNFKKELKHFNLQYVGSSNQHLYRIQDSKVQEMDVMF